MKFAPKADRLSFSRDPYLLVGTQGFGGSVSDSRTKNIKINAIPWL